MRSFSLPAYVTSATPHSGVGRVSYAIQEKIKNKARFYLVLFDRSSSSLIVKDPDGKEVYRKIGFKRLGNFFFFLSLKKFIPSFPKVFIDNQNLSFLSLPNSCTMVYDLFYLTHPRSLIDKSHGFYAYSGISKSKLLLTDSDYATNEVIRKYGIPKSKVLTKKLGYDRNLFNYESNHVSLNSIISPNEKFLIHLSSGEKRKNLLGIIKAYKILFEQGIVYHLILGGAAGKGKSREKVLNNLTQHQKKYVHFPGFISDEDVSELYRNASAALYPSFAEGFCLPALEAQACGCPVVTSTETALPEISGPLSVQANPFDPINVANSIEKAVRLKKNPQLHIANKDFIQAYQWDDLANEVVRFFKN